ARGYSMKKLTKRRLLRFRREVWRIVAGNTIQEDVRLHAQRRRSTMRFGILAAALVVGIALSGCSGSPSATPMAPPVGGSASSPGAQGVYNWQDVPRGQQVPVSAARFDQGGYQ